MVDAIILAGGLGTRLSGTVPNLPKSMAPINGRPFLELQLDQLIQLGVTNVILAVGYKSDELENHFKNGYKNLAITFSKEEKPKGTGGALRAALRLAESETVLALNGDSFVELDIEQALVLSKKHSAPVMFVAEVDDVARYGSVLIDKDGRLIGFSEKGKNGPGKINAGAYLLSKEIFSTFVHDDPFSFESDFLPELIRQQDVYVTSAGGRFIDIGTPEDFARAQEYLK